MVVEVSKLGTPLPNDISSLAQANSDLISNINQIDNNAMIIFDDNNIDLLDSFSKDASNIDKKWLPIRISVADVNANDIKVGGNALTDDNYKGIEGASTFVYWVDADSIVGMSNAEVITLSAENKNDTTIKIYI